MSVFYCVCLLFLNLIALTYSTKLKSLGEISALLNNKTNIKNDHELLDKLNVILQGGSDQLQIVTDFDLTLTADPGENSKRVLNSYEMLRLCPSIPQTYKDEDTKLFYRYKPIESDPNLSVEEKSRYMVEWYRASHNLLRGLKYPREELKNIAQNVKNSFREGVRTLIDWSKTHNVPVLVMSSGLGDAVVASLEAADLLAPNVKVISNFLELDGADMITGMKGDPIHSFNKNEASLKNTHYYKNLKGRINVILMGDSVGDANMTDGIDNCNTVIKIGFLSTKNRKNLQNYLNNFDIVIENDQTMVVVNSVINLM